MITFYNSVQDAGEEDFLPVATAISYYESEFGEALKDLTPKGTIWDLSKKIPGLMAFRYSQMQDLESILQLITMRADKAHTESKKFYKESYTRELTDKMANDYAAARSEVYNLRVLQNEVALIRNKYLGVTKGLEALHYQIRNLVELRKAGIEDALI